jgi:hypothetical protein
LHVHSLLGASREIWMGIGNCKTWIVDRSRDRNRKPWLERRDCGSWIVNRRCSRNRNRKSWSERLLLGAFLGAFTASHIAFVGD